MTLGALLFDLDGTLLDTEPGIVAGLRHTMQLLGLDIPDYPVLKAQIGPPLEQALGNLMPTALIPKAVEVYREYYNQQGKFEASVFEGIHQALSHLSGYTLLVATSKRRVFAVDMLEHFGLAQHFSAVYGVQPSNLSEPKASLIAKAIREQNLSPQRCVMIGDRHFDVEGAKAHGLKAIGALWGYGNPTELAQADWLCPTPSDLPGGIAQQPEWFL